MSAFNNRSKLRRKNRFTSARNQEASVSSAARAAGGGGADAGATGEAGGSLGRDRRGVGGRQAGRVGGLMG